MKIMNFGKRVVRILGTPARARRRRAPVNPLRLESLEGRALLATVTVSVVDFAFNPGPVSIHQGDTVHWVWNGDMHSTTSVAGIAETWNSGEHDTGFTFDHTFIRTGTFAYFCSVHGHDNGNGTAGGMSGSITVTPGAPATPPSADFVIGADNQVDTRPLDATGKPNGGYSVLAPGQVKDLAATRLGVGRNFEAFVIGLDDRVYAETILGGTRRGYFATAQGSVASVSAGTDAAGNPLLFSIGTDHQLYEQKFDASGNATSTSDTKAAFGDFRSTVLTHDATGTPLLYAVGQDGQVYGLKLNAGGVPTGGLFKMASGGVKQLAVGASASGAPEVFVVGLDDFAYALKADATGGPAGGYFGVGGPVKSISVGSDSAGRPLIFAVGGDDQVYGHRFDDAGAPTGGFYGTASGPATSVVAGAAAGGNPELFVVLSKDSQVYLGPLDPTGASTGPFALTTPGAVKKVVAV